MPLSGALKVNLEEQCSYVNGSALVLKVSWLFCVLGLENQFKAVLGVTSRQRIPDVQS